MLSLKKKERCEMALLGLRPYKTISALNRDEIVDLGGILVKKADGELKSGDLYVAERNTGPHLLTCREINRLVP